MATEPVAVVASTRPTQAPTLVRTETSRTSRTAQSIPPPGSVLTGKQEHYLKRELISQQAKWEISELSNPTALHRFGAPFRSDAGEVAPEDSEFPILRYLFNHHVRNFPFLDQAREKEFWQDKLQQFLESFTSKNVSASDDRLEETKRKKLAHKVEKAVELFMVSGIPTSSGYEERIRFAEMEVVDRGANEKGLVANAPDGDSILGWSVNVAAVRTTSVKRHVRYHQYPEYLISVKRKEEPQIFVGRRFSEFVELHRRLRMEMPGKVLHPLPRKNRSVSLLSRAANDDEEDEDEDDDDDEDDKVSMSSTSTHEKAISLDDNNLKPVLPSTTSHFRKSSANSFRTTKPKRSFEASSPRIILYQEEQRVSLRAFLRTVLQNEHIAKSEAMTDFLTARPVKLNEEEQLDIRARHDMDERRLEEQKLFYEIARRRARELDIHMEKFRRDVIERNGLESMFQEIKDKNSIEDLSPAYRKVCEWLRIEIAATIYHLFLAEDNSPELFSQAKRIHSLVPYTILKNVIRLTNPAAVMSGVLDLFLAQPFGTRSLLQRIFGLSLYDSYKTYQKAIETLTKKIDQQVFCDRIRAYVGSNRDLKLLIQQRADEEGVDKLVPIMKAEELQPALSSSQYTKIFNGYVTWNFIVENVDAEMHESAELFTRLKQYLKLYTRQCDKMKMIDLIEEPNTLRLFRDLFSIFYEPLVRVYKSANVYNSITDFAAFADDAVRVIEAAQRQDVLADPNQTVQAFIDLCARHEGALYKFVHEVHSHDKGLFTQLFGWMEAILDFLRQGPTGGSLDLNALFQGALGSKAIDKELALAEVSAIVKWQMARKRWHHDKTRQKLAQGGNSDMPSFNNFKSTDLGLKEGDIDELAMDSSDDLDDSQSDIDSDVDMIGAERRSRDHARHRLRQRAGEPPKPAIAELCKLMPDFVVMLRRVLAD